MASDKTLNAKNLAALGADLRAELLLDLAEGDAATQRQLRLELGSRSVIPRSSRSAEKRI